MNRDSSGPALVQNVHVSGFDTGVAVRNLLFGTTFEYLQLEGQKKVGIEVKGHMAAIRRLTSVNRVPALRLTGWASSVVLLDSQLRGGAPNQPAIKVEDAPTLLLRNVGTAGYTAAAKLVSGQTKKTPPAGKVAEFLASEVFAAAPPPPACYQRGRFNPTGLGERLLRNGPDGAAAYIGCNTGSQPCGLTLVEGFTRALGRSRAPRLGDC